MKLKCLAFALLLIAGNAPAGVASAQSAEPSTRPGPPIRPNPYPMGALERLEITSHDGTVLRGWLRRPVLPEGFGAPIVLHSTPYLGACTENGCRPTPEDEVWWSDDPPRNSNPFTQMGLAPKEIVEAGFALAYVSVRGTGNSGGCLDVHGEDEQKDQVAIVEYLASREWSNGRVGMVGASYPSATALAAAVHKAEGLAGIAITGLTTNLYELFVTPQGAASTITTSLAPLALSGWTQTVPLGSQSDDYPSRLLGYLPVAAERDTHACPLHNELIGLMARDDRNPAYFDERNLLDDLHQVEVPVLMAQGFLDWADGAGHLFQERDVWEALPDDIPKRMIEGQWAHCFPRDLTEETKNTDCYPGTGVPRWDETWEDANWHDILMGWLDYYVRGHGPEPRVDVADYQDDTGEWHSSSAWPPAERRDEVLYLSDERFTATPSESQASFLSAPNGLNSWDGGYNHLPADQNTEKGSFPVYQSAALCGPSGEEAVDADGLVYKSQPLGEDVLIAGNPFAHLELSSTLPGGLVTVKLLDLSPDFGCDEYHRPHGLRTITQGAADLRFHRGNHAGVDFRTGQRTPVRVDMYDTAMKVRAGHRLAVLVSYGETHGEYSNAGIFPFLTLHEGVDISQVVIPVVEGTVGGTTSTATYLPRPFLE